MNVVFRVDASERIGGGHLSRCMTLAAGFAKHHCNIYFISSQLPDSYIHVLTTLGYKVELILPKVSDIKIADRNFSDLSQENDAALTLKVLKGLVVDLLIVDHYELDYEWESCVRCHVTRLMIIDDLANRRHCCDVLLDSNFHAHHYDRYSNLIEPKTLFLGGPSYAILRQEFKQARPHVKIRNGRVDRLLIFFGASDSHDYTSKAIEAVRELCPGTNVDVVVGSMNTHLNKIKNLCMSYSYDLHVDIDYMSSLMAKADCSIGAGGIALWERCSLGLPTFVIPTASNQYDQVNSVAAYGAVYSLKDYQSRTEIFAEDIQSFLLNESLRASISERSFQLVDCMGIDRILSRLGFPQIEIRRALESDCENVFSWRNFDLVRLASTNSNSIGWENHLKWFNDVIKSKVVVLLIGEHVNEEVGVVRYDLDHAVATVSIYLTPNYLGLKKGFGAFLLQASHDWLIKNHPEVKKIKAVVRDGNEASHKLFNRAGYRLIGSIYEKNLYQ